MAMNSFSTCLFWNHILYWSLFVKLVDSPCKMLLCTPKHAQLFICILLSAEGVVEIWLTSEDTGAYGKDIGVTLPQLLWKLVDVIPDGCMLRLGMTNPPYILEHLEVCDWQCLCLVWVLTLNPPIYPEVVKKRGFEVVYMCDCSNICYILVWFTSLSQFIFCLFWVSSPNNTDVSCQSSTFPSITFFLLQEMAKILNHSRVYSFLHVPVQAGSDNVLLEMRREYTVEDFKHVVDFLKERYTYVISNITELQSCNNWDPCNASFQNSHLLGYVCNH